MKGIIMTAESVRAILDGRKTMTRRVVKYNGRTPSNSGREKLYKMVDMLNGKSFYGAGFYKDSDVFEYEGKAHTNAIYFKSPYKPGEIVYVKEAWMKVPNIRKWCIEYWHKAELSEDDLRIVSEWPGKWSWKSPMFMPRAAARIFLRVKSVRAEMVQEITELDATDEGCIDNRCFIHAPENEYDIIHTAKEEYKKIWDQINAKRGYSWESNPWVWVYTFERITKEEAEKEDRAA